MSWSGRNDGTPAALRTSRGIDRTFMVRGLECAHCGSRRVRRTWMRRGPRDPGYWYIHCLRSTCQQGERTS